MEEKCSQVQSALAEFKAWQALSPKDALQELGTFQHALETAGSMTVDTKSCANLKTSISFTKPMSEVFACLENHGSRLEFPGPQGCVTTSQDNSVCNDCESTSTPPSKRKKISQ